MDTENSKNTKLKEKIEKIVETHDDEIFLSLMGGLGLIAGGIIGSSITRRKYDGRIKELISFYEEEKVNNLTKIMPKTNTLYLVERYNNHSGRTYGSWNKMSDLIKETIDVLKENKDV